MPDNDDLHLALMGGYEMLKPSQLEVIPSYTAAYLKDVIGFTSDPSRERSSTYSCFFISRLFCNTSYLHSQGLDIGNVVPQVDHVEICGTFSNAMATPERAG